MIFRHALHKLLKPIHELKLRRNHPVEWALIQRRHITENVNPSILHFSVNKAATQYVKELLAKVGIENGMTTVHLHGYSFNSDFPFLDHLSADEMQQYAYLFKPKGYIYSVFGGPIENIPNMDAFRTVLMVRDPRDVLTSMYYSSAYSHAVPAATGDKRDYFLERRTHTRQISIDQFVLENAERERAIYQRYTDLFIRQHSNLHLIRYEEMIADFDAWFNSLLEYCQLEISPSLRQTLYTEAEKVRPVTENIYAHIRKGQAGDYLSKLQPETIAYLNEVFVQVLKDYHYA
jgi:hypothetical protein